MMFCWFLQYSEVTPNMIDFTTYLTKKIKLNIPMMSAGMDTVTEHQHGNCYGKTGWYRYHPQKHVYRGSGGGSGQGKTFRKWSYHRPIFLIPRSYISMTQKI